MPRRWQVWAQPDGRLVWIPAPEAAAPPLPPVPTPPRTAAAADLPATPPSPRESGTAPDPRAASDDALVEGLGVAYGCRVESMADVFAQARSKLIDGNGMTSRTGDGGKDGLFCSGSGRTVPVSERAIRRARALIGDEACETNNKRIKQSFGDGADAESGYRETDVSYRGDVHRDSMSPVFQTGSGKAVSLSKDSLRKARVVLEDVDAASAGAVQPLFQTGMGRSVPVTRTSIGKARAVLEGQTIAKQGVDGMEQFPLFHTGSGRAVSVSVASLQKAKAVLVENNTGVGNMESFAKPDQPLMLQTGLEKTVLISERHVERPTAAVKEGGAENSGHWDTDCQFPMFQTGLGRPVAVSWSSIQKASTVLDEVDIKKSGHSDTIVCATTLQTETPRSVLMSSRLIMNDRTVTPEGDGSMQEKNHEDGDHHPLFQTALGKPVSVSKSSIKWATAVLEPRNIAKELEDESHLDGGHDTARSKTGLGQSILASERTTRKVQDIFEAKEAVKVNNDDGEGFAEDETLQEFLPQNRSSINKANILMDPGNFAEKGYDDCRNQLPMFQTGSGKSVLIRESSVQKARSVLQEEGNRSRDNHKLLNNMDKKFPVFSSPLKTSCTKTVNISSGGVSRAATLLGLEENTFSTQFFGHVGDKLGTKISIERENTEQRLGIASVYEISDDRLRSSCPTENQVLTGSHHPFRFSENAAVDSGTHPMRFSTAGGRSMAISSDALLRAKNLLGETDLVVSVNGSIAQSLSSACTNKMPFLTVDSKEGESDFSGTRWANGKTELATFSHQAITDRKQPGSFGYVLPDIALSNENTNRFHVGREYHSISEVPKIPNPSSIYLSETDKASDTKGNTRRPHMPAGVLVDVTNHMATHSGSTDHGANEKRRIGGRNSVSPFKRPRSSRFVTPINTNKQSSAGAKRPPTQSSPCRTTLSACYPFQHKRKTWKEHFGGPPCFEFLTENVTDEVKLMDAKRAEKYKFQNTDIGAEECQKMLLACGASLTYATKEWVRNHYKWIVWKLASLERCYPTKAAGKFLTVANVIDELKYRYDREVNNGHRSAIKKILEGNALPSLMMVLCISAIYSHPDMNTSKLEVGRADTNVDSIDNKSLLATKRNMSARIELTDGWYALDSLLDAALSEQLEKGKISVGQKLRIWGASLYGWTGPVSFHEASGTVKLMVHVNGTYRARWDDTLGFCKHDGLPLAFKCIKASGGRVPRTLVGVARIYPVLYKERLLDGRSVVRSERMERKAIQLYYQRVSKIQEDILSVQDENCGNTDDSEEGAKICKMLERAAEPEVMMASMTSEQIISLSSYQAKQMVVRQNKVAKKVEKALEAAGLSSRDVTPFLKVRVMSLVSKSSATKTSNKEGIITIWDPTEKQKSDLVEGQIYFVTGLVPSTYCPGILYLHARGSSTIWNLLAPAQATSFVPFFTPRKAVDLSTFSEVPLASEFDIAGVVLHVGDVYLCSSLKRQWLFLTDGSKFMSAQKSEQDDCLLAVSFSCPASGDDSAFFSYALSGNIVGFSNLVKRQKDQMRLMWVAEATESSIYSLSHEISKNSHLKEAATRAEKWALSSCPKIQQLKERVLCIIGDSGG